jgi:hypothetical protein
LAALNSQDLQYDFRVSKTLERRGNHIANLWTWYSQTLPLARFLSLHALSDADLMPRSDVWLMSFAVHASLGNTIVRVRRVWVK